MALDEAVAIPASAERRGRCRHRRSCHRRRIARLPRRGAVASWTSPGAYSSRWFDEGDSAWSAEGPQSGLAPARSTRSGRITLPSHDDASRTVQSHCPPTLPSAGSTSAPAATQSPVAPHHFCWTPPPRPPRRARTCTPWLRATRPPAANGVDATNAGVTVWPAPLPRSRVQPAQRPGGRPRDSHPQWQPVLRGRHGVWRGSVLGHPGVLRGGRVPAGPAARAGCFRKKRAPDCRILLCLVMTSMWCA